MVDEATAKEYTTDGKTEADIENWFTYHAPKPDQIPRYGIIRDKAKELAHVIVRYCPPCADRTVALRALRDTVMNCNLSIACNE